jgi:uncharacterized delta-60 repeat protein
VTTTIDSNAYGEAIAIQSNGKVVVAGGSFNGVQNSFTLARYTITGSLDSSFSSSGIVTTSIGSTAEGLGLIIQSDSKIVIAGQSLHGNQTGFALARYLGEQPNLAPPQRTYLPMVLKQ